MRLPLVMALAVLGCARAQVRADDAAAGVDFFEARIRPVLIEKCYSCHSAKAPKLKGGLRLDDRGAMRKGGDSGPAVVPGQPEESLLLRAIAHAEDCSPMPPKEKLPAAVVADFRRWVTMGAPDPRGEGPGQGPAAASSSQSQKTGRTWWSLRPITNPTVPRLSAEESAWARTPIDAFIVARLREKGLEPAPEADRRTLIRRLSFDLLGLPPTPEEVAAFLADRAPDAYERLVDRLLASPHRGERLARPWMDLVHFAETHGHDQDRIRPSAWPFRDYLIEAFNADKPFARFVEEQVAADVLFPGEPRLVVALGMIAAGPWDESSLRDIRDDSIDRQIGHYVDRDDMVSTVMSSFVSMTVHCARCHDHKFDPISQQDYYGLQAVFAGVERAERSYDPDPQISLRRQALHVAQKLRPGDVLLGELELATLPPPRLVYAAASEFVPDGRHKPPGAPRPVHVLKRGDIHNPSTLAVPGSLTCLEELPGQFRPSRSGDEGARRAALARWLADPRNPLTYRSIVNRLWQIHLGRGIVDSPNDFGRMGALPSHPELLDWLAARFLAEGGSIRRLERLIVTSAVYRQSTTHDRRAAEVDADNRLLWRMNRRRLDAESVHDAMLETAGQLDRTMGGPSVRQFGLRPGPHVTPVIDYTAYDWSQPGSGRRSVYRFLFRTLPDPMMDSLDEADASQLTAARNESITPLQALALLNNPFVVHQSECLAARLQREARGTEEQIARAFELLFGRAPAADELAELGGYVRSHGLANLCRLLLNTNEFLYVN
jgi:hypothetical protein